jgi:hypothetical protein
LQTDIFLTLFWPFSCDYIFWLRDLKFGVCTKDSINKTCWKNGKDLSNGAPKIKLWNHTKKTHFPVFAKNFRRPWMKLKFFFCQKFPNPWTLRVSGMGGYTSNCEKSQNHCTLLYILFDEFADLHCFRLNTWRRRWWGSGIICELVGCPLTVQACSVGRRVQWFSPFQKRKKLGQVPLLNLSQPFRFVVLCFVIDTLAVGMEQICK